MNEAKQWCQDYLLKWGLMRLELMEEYNPQELEALLADGSLKASLQATEESLSDQLERLDKQDSSLYLENREVSREQLMEQYVRNQPESQEPTE